MLKIKTEISNPSTLTTTAADLELPGPPGDLPERVALQHDQAPQPEHFPSPPGGGAAPGAARGHPGLGPHSRPAPTAPHPPPPPPPARLSPARRPPRPWPPSLRSPAVAPVVGVPAGQAPWGRERERERRGGPGAPTPCCTPGTWRLCRGCGGQRRAAAGAQGDWDPGGHQHGRRRGSTPRAPSGATPAEVTLAMQGNLLPRTRTLLTADVNEPGFSASTPRRPMEMLTTTCIGSTCLGPLGRRGERARPDADAGRQRVHHGGGTLLHACPSRSTAMASTRHRLWSARRTERAPPGGLARARPSRRHRRRFRLDLDSALDPSRSASSLLRGPTVPLPTPFFSFFLSLDSFFPVKIFFILGLQEGQTTGCLPFLSSSEMCVGLFCSLCIFIEMSFMCICLT